MAFRKGDAVDKKLAGAHTSSVRQQGRAEQTEAEPAAFKNGVAKRGLCFRAE